MKGRTVVEHEDFERLNLLSEDEATVGARDLVF